MTAAEDLIDVTVTQRGLPYTVTDTQVLARVARVIVAGSDAQRPGRGPVTDIRTVPARRHEEKGRTDAIRTV